MSRNRAYVLILLGIVVLGLILPIPGYSDRPAGLGLNGHIVQTDSNLQLHFDKTLVLHHLYHPESLLQGIQSQIPSRFLDQLFPLGAASLCSILYQSPFDFRRAIRQCIPHCFNASKYKQHSLAA